MDLEVIGNIISIRLLPLFSFRCYESDDIVYRSEFVIKLNPGFRAVSGLILFHRLSYVYIAYQGFFFSNFCTDFTMGKTFFTITETSRIVVLTMKKNSNINTMSGKDAVEIAGTSLFPFFFSFAIYFPPIFLGSASDIANGIKSLMAS